MGCQQISLHARWGKRPWASNPVESPWLFLFYSLIYSEDHKVKVHKMPPLSGKDRQAHELRLRANGKMRDKRYAAALIDYTRALEQTPGSVALLSNRAATLQALGAYDDAIIDLYSATSKDPTFIPAWCRLGYAFLHQGNTVRALQAYVQAVKVASKHPKKPQKFMSELKESIKLAESRARQQGYTQDYIDELVPDDVRMALDSYKSLTSSRAPTQGVSVPEISISDLYNMVANPGVFRQQQSQSGTQSGARTPVPGAPTPQTGTHTPQEGSQTDRGTYFSFPEPLRDILPPFPIPPIGNRDQAMSFADTIMTIVQSYVSGTNQDHPERIVDPARGAVNAWLESLGMGFGAQRAQQNETGNNERDQNVPQNVPRNEDSNPAGSENAAVVPDDDEDIPMGVPEEDDYGRAAPTRTATTQEEGQSNGLWGALRQTLINGVQSLNAHANNNANQDNSHDDNLQMPDVD
ncbi:unnamed protein product [Kuraishia capsulata CBS 1993]|uniref:Uncharacterized protein n=1 Tax=Kuraishia capsulata CBS 1993 TaxID=1382522 RepID=W6MGI6_9ASCO|nr:uncharacterized protein KUCA_T00001196001 [Kuraishia capsulata CBS 1993]CDK25229.1 unnamed protein product [Kuraishia capsulata CBS 1993]